MNKETTQDVRVRIAPSPTGFMHIGTLRTALTNYLFARRHKGTFIIRLEDTDQKRYVAGSTEDIIASLAWAGITWDEGIDLKEGKLSEKGPYGPYVQSKRLGTYQKYIKELLAKGDAYYCFCTPERLEAMRQRQQKQGEAPMYDRHCLKMPKSEIEERLRKKEPHVIRMKVPENGVTEFNDLVRGSVTIENKVVDDQVLIKSDGFPTYHFAVVIDDHLMCITHILRGEEWLPSTPKHILLYKMFGWTQPQFGHLPQLLNLNGKKLSKRDGDVSVRDFIEKGYLPEAIINFIALLGWNPKTTQEIFSMEELVEAFDVAKINKAGAKFEYGRLDWFGAHYIKKMNDLELYEKAKGYLNKLGVDSEKGKRIASIQKERMSKLSDISAGIEYLISSEIIYERELLRWKNMDDQAIVEKLTIAKEVIRSLSDGNYELNAIQEKLMSAASDKRGEFLWPLRVALTGQKQSPSPFECVWVLGKKESLRRVEEAIAKMS